MKKTYSVSEAAKALGYSNNSVYSFLKKGEIKGLRLGRGKFRIRQEEIDRLLNRAPKVVPVALRKPRPGKRVSELGSDKPLRTIILWFEERAGLPKLFDWFVALSSLVLGISLFLYTRQLDSLLAGKYAIWFTPIEIALLAGGVGLILADMLAEESPLYKNFNNLFRFVLVAAYVGLTLLQIPARDVDGFLINGLFAMVILIETLLGVLSSTAYMLYIQGLLIGVTLILRYYPGDSGLSELSQAVYGVVDGNSWVFGVMTLVFVAMTLFGYFWNKMVLKTVLGISGVFLVTLSVYYANVGYYARSFFILITGMIGMLLPFWEQFKRRYEEDRTLSFRMFGTVLMAFSLAVLIVGSVQTVLINVGMRNLQDKADYVRLRVEGAVDNAESTLEGLTQNGMFTRAVMSRNFADLSSFLKAVFKNNRSFNSVMVADLSGKVLAVYPGSIELSGADFSESKFFVDTVISGKTYVSEQVEFFTPDIEKAVIVSIPVTEERSKRIIGVAAVTLSAEYLSEEMQTIAEGVAGQVITIVDGKGRWIVFPETGIIGSAVTEADATYDLWNSSTGQTRGYDRFGRYSLFASIRSDLVGWTVVVSQPMTTVLDVSRSGLILVLFLLMVASVTVVFTYIFSKNKRLSVEKSV